MNKALFHIPHCSKYIPLQFRDQFLLTKEELRRELLYMTDYKTDELFYLDEHQIYIKGTVSRLVADLERFPIDEEEPMSKVGMGAVYTKTSDNKPLRRELLPEEKNYLMNRYYYKHHNTLNEAVKKLLEENGTVILFDCHSFSSHKLPYEQCTSNIRPDICIGSDEYHTPKEIAEVALRFFQDRGYETALNIPFAGSLVPSDYYQKNKNVISIMIEVNRKLYMNEAAGRISKSFIRVKTDINQCSRKIIERIFSGVGMVI